MILAILKKKIKILLPQLHQQKFAKGTMLQYINNGTGAAFRVMFGYYDKTSHEFVYRLESLAVSDTGQMYNFRADWVEKQFRAVSLPIYNSLWNNLNG